MNTREILILKTLQRKQRHAGDKLSGSDQKQADFATKNVCAHVGIELADEVEEMCGLLGLNKREIVTMALREFLDQAWRTMDEFGVRPRQ